MNHPTPSSRLVGASHCSHLRHKGMYVLSVAEPTDFHDSYDATAYWCTRTQKPLGPDGRPARADVCQAGRECCSHE
jgi:hypothetical protein